MKSSFVSDDSGLGNRNDELPALVAEGLFLGEDLVLEIPGQQQHVVRFLGGDFFRGHDGHMLPGHVPPLLVHILVSHEIQQVVADPHVQRAELGLDRAIVSTTAGTTRDTIEEGLVIDGIPLRLVDTAGLRDTDCDIEQEGIKRAYKSLNKSDIQLFIVDGSRDIDKEDHAHITQLDPGPQVDDTPPR